MFTDSHCHLSFPEYRDALPGLLAQMRVARVSRAMCICTTLEEFDTVRTIATQNDEIFASVGVHPDNEGVQEPTLEILVSLAAHKKVLAIGETGLDYYRLNGRTLGDMHWQRERFRVHIRAARQCNKPLVVHTRSASGDTLSILREEGEDGSASTVGGVFHCFTESIDVARAVLDMGYFISFSGIVTFTSARELREVVSYVPMDRMLIETDSPYLAPVPHRGKTNTPAWVPHVAEAIAQVKKRTADDIGAQTSANFDRLFINRPV